MDKKKLTKWFTILVGALFLLELFVVVLYKPADNLKTITTSTLAAQSFDGYARLTASLHSLGGKLLVECGSKPLFTNVRNDLQAVKGISSATALLASTQSTDLYLLTVEDNASIQAAVKGVNNTLFTECNSWRMRRISTASLAGNIVLQSASDYSKNYPISDATLSAYYNTAGGYYPAFVAVGHEVNDSLELVLQAGASVDAYGTITLTSALLEEQVPLQTAQVANVENIQSNNTNKTNNTQR